jgi:hypothetical protein
MFASLLLFWHGTPTPIVVGPTPDPRRSAWSSTDPDPRRSSWTLVGADPRRSTWTMSSTDT